jgi:small subunit ribosomal protein S21
MSRLKKLLQREGVFKELRDRQSFEKPSMKRKKAKAAARKRYQKEQAKRLASS